MFELGSGSGRSLPGKVSAGKIIFQEMRTGYLRLSQQERQGEFGGCYIVWRNCPNDQGTWGQ